PCFSVTVIDWPIGGGDYPWPSVVDPQPQPQPRPVPWRTILAVVGAVVGTVVVAVILWEVRKIVTWLLIAAFLAIILNPVVDFFEKRLHFRRGLAILTVFLLAIGLFAAMLYAFIRPIVDQSQEF